MPVSRRVFAGVAFASLADLGRGQQPEVIRAEASLVLAPVTVLGRNGQAVHGLTKDDFSLRVDGIVTKIANFDAHEEEQPGGVRRQSRELARKDTVQPRGRPRIISNIPGGISGHSTTIVLLMDYLNTDLRDRLAMRETALRFFTSRLTTGQSFAVYGLSYRLVPLLAPSADPALLERAAKTALGETQTADPPESGILAAGPGSGSDAAIEYLKLRFARQNFVRDQRDRSARTLAAFRQIARAFAGVPGKKVLLWLTGDASPLNPSLLYSIMLDAPDLEANTASSGGLARTFESLNHSNMTVFPVDVRGIKNTGLPSPSEELSHTEFSQLRRGTQPDEVNIYEGATDRREGEAANSSLAMETCARETGGEVLRGSNDLETLLERARETWEAYYVLSFVPPAAPAKRGRYVRIGIKVNRKHVRVLHRQGFWLGPKAPSDQRTAIADVIATSVDATEMPLRLVAGRTDHGKIPFSLSVSLSSDSFAPVERTFSLVIAVLTLDENGTIVSRQGESLAGRADEKQQQRLIERGTEYRASFPTDHATTGRVIVLDNATGRIGSVTLDIASLISPVGQ